jgi:6-pyruvoyltetrahydropterin/6-carboxytetrahydropterin synthase
MIEIQRYHDISCGHRLVGHEGRCRFLHGHNYRITFVCTAPQLDTIGRIADFAVIKERLCQWLEDHWDHRFLIWDQDPLLTALQTIVADSLVIIPFNPTAENMAMYLTCEVGPQQLFGTTMSLIRCTVEETRKCAATYSLTTVEHPDGQS